MSKSLGNTVVPQDVIKQSGADILRLWVVTTDYWEDQRLGKNVLQTNIDAYRKLRNTIRWMLGTLAHDEGDDGAGGEDAGTGAADAAPAGGTRRGRARRLRRLRLQAHHARAVDFMVVELSAFYFDIRKDALYCDAPSSLKRKAAVQVVRHLFDCLVKWLAPMLPFTTEEAWLERYPDAESVHLEQFPRNSGRLEERRAGREMAKGQGRFAASSPARWRSSGRRRPSARRWRRCRSSTWPMRRWKAAIAGVDMAEIGITSGSDGFARRAPRRALSRLPTCPAWRWSSRRPRTRPEEMRALLALHRRCRPGPGVSGRVGQGRRGAAVNCAALGRL